MLKKSQFLMILHETIQEFMVVRPIPDSNLCRDVAKRIATSYQIFFDDPRYTNRDHPIILVMLDFALFSEFSLVHQIALERAWEYYEEKSRPPVALHEQ